MCKNHLADIGLTPLHHYKILVILVVLLTGVRTNILLICIVTLYTTPRNRYKLWREEIIAENNEVIKRIVARIVSVFFCLLANSWSNLEVLFSLNPSEGQGKNHPSKFRVSHFIADSK